MATLKEYINRNEKNENPSSEYSRRRFLKQSALFGSLTILPSRFVLGKKSSSGELPPSERVRLAMIGIGNMGNGDRIAMLRSGLCDIVALCDVDLEGEHTLESRYCHGLTDKKPDKPEEEMKVYGKARAFNDFRKMFDEMGSEIDAVVVATPDHSHFCAAMLAMSLGKHVYVEKPLAHTFGQCERLMDLASRSGVATQMGNQGHSGANYFQFKAWTEAGVIKDVTKIQAFMNKPRRWHGWGETVSGYFKQPMPEHIAWDQWISSAQEHPYSDRLHPAEWRSWFDYGSGAFGDWGPHILDTCHRFLKLGLPSEVTAVKREGANPFVFPQASTIRFNFPKRHGMPACTVTWYDGQDNYPEVDEKYGDLAVDESTGKKVRKPVNVDGPGKIIYGKDYVFKGWSHSSPLRIIPEEKFQDVVRTLPRFSQKNSDHHENFLLACKGEEETRSPFSVSGTQTQVFNIGVLAQRFGGTLEFDRDQKKITNNKAANALLDPAPRMGWEEFYKL